MYPRTIPGLYHERVERFGDRVLCYSKDPTSRQWVASTWRESGAETRVLTCGLLGLGVKPGDRVGVLSETRREWSAADLAIVCAGAVTVGVYPTSTPEQCAYVLQHAETEVVFVEDRHQLDKLLAIRDQLPSLEKVVLFDEAGGIQNPDVIGLQEIADAGVAYDAEHPDAFEERWRAVQPGDLAMLVYTSGTTGPPKGVMLTHDNIYATIEAVHQVLPSRDDDLGVVFLPLAHSLQRVAGYVGLYNGVCGVYAERIEKIIEHMQEFRPTVQAAVPRIYEKVHAKIHSRVEEQPPHRQAIFRWAVRVGREVSRLKRASQPVPLPLRVKHRLADKLVLRKIRDVFGGRVRYMISGAAPIALELLEFFHACGVTILEGYGLTETTAPATVNLPEDFRFGTVGRSLPLCEVKIVDDGEILIKGGNVFKGYYKDEAATAEAFTEDGWFRSGDIGEMDADGFLRITDRKKELIITAAGKNVSPANIENLVKSNPLISQCVVHGDRRKFLVALITIDPEELEQLARKLNISPAEIAAGKITEHTRVLGEVQLCIDRVNRELARYETIKYFRVLEAELSGEDDLLTPTLKLKRRNIEERYRHLLDEMYAMAKAPRMRPGDVAR